MNSLGRRFVFSVVAFLLALNFVSSKSIDTSEPEAFRKNQVEFSRSLAEDSSPEAELFKYLLTKELMNRHENAFEWEEHQRKRNYWKQCAFNAVSCFGRK